ncbi:tRNA (adenosine(37)-N6)-dimethylallyltransferase MiaA [Rhodopila sp.]|uniref:tRNA (adenosine(37)-N6)-dimethylallyltransferase MiaA n=1 Tax=Rhodopila sp. TaxID=2480087 RepID=UPI003D1453DD
MPITPTAVMTTTPPALLIAGPTASGKSALALAIAERIGGTIINTDSMQVYRELRILTARPTVAEEDRIPHRLYGVRAAAEAGSVAWWRYEALAAMRQSHAAGRRPILTGGSGLYFAALTGGLADVPDPGPDARTEARRLLQAQGSAALHASLTRVDPATAARLKPEDSQRVARAWEVWRGTGTGLAAWQTRRATPAPWRFSAILLDPPRDALRGAIAGRFDVMLRQGALAEVRSLLALDLDPALPAMRAHGVPELSAHLRGVLSLDEARHRTEQVTGQYTKRQATWFRHHTLAEQTRMHIIRARFMDLTQFSERERQDLFMFIEDGG